MRRLSGSRWALLMVAGGLLPWAGAAFPGEMPPLRLGGTLEAVAPICPMPEADLALTLVAGLGEVDLSSRTDMTLYPYTQAKETVGVSLIRDWLTLGGDLSFSLLPIGITQARLFARAAPPHALWESERGVLDVAFLGEARAKGYSLATIAQRSELWVKGTGMFVTTQVPWIEEMGGGAWLEGILSAPGPARLGVEATLVASARWGSFCLQSETALSLTPLRFDEQRLVATGTWDELGLDVEATLTLGGAYLALGAELKATLRFGEGRTPIPSSACVGGVCTDW